MKHIVEAQDKNINQMEKTCKEMLARLDLLIVVGLGFSERVRREDEYSGFG